MDYIIVELDEGQDPHTIAGGAVVTLTDGTTTLQGRVLNIGHMFSSDSPLEGRVMSLEAHNHGVTGITGPPAP